MSIEEGGRRVQTPAGRLVFAAIVGFVILVNAVRTFGPASLFQPELSWLVVWLGVWIAALGAAGAGGDGSAVRGSRREAPLVAPRRPDADRPDARARRLLPGLPPPAARRTLRSREAVRDRRGPVPRAFPLVARALGHHAHRDPVPRRVRRIAVDPHWSPARPDAPSPGWRD